MRWTVVLWLALFTTAAGAVETRDPETYFFNQTFGDFSEELENAREQGKKGILIMFEMEECPFCHRMKQRVLNRKDVQDYFREHFLIFSVDIVGGHRDHGFQGQSHHHEGLRLQAVQGKGHAGIPVLRSRGQSDPPGPLHGGDPGRGRVSAAGPIHRGRGLQEDRLHPLQEKPAQAMRTRGVLAAFCLLGILAVQADPLPQPLSLEQALLLAESSHPTLQLAAAREATAAANLQQVSSRNDLLVSLLGRLAYLEPAQLSNFQQNNDSSAHLLMEKRLYDFGYSEAQEASAERELDAARLAGLDARQQHRIEVMKAFFDVLLADLEYARDNEAMSIAYVRLDKARNRHELGELSDVELLKIETRYQQILSRRTASEAKQRETRTRLALALNRPAELPSELVEPEAPDLDKPLLEVAELMESVLRENPRILGLQAKVDAARQALVAADRRYGPVLRGELAANAWNRETRSTNPFEAALVLELPLYSGGRDDAETAAARSALMEAEAELALLRYQLRQKVTELWLAQQKLKRRARELAVRDEYRELYLDRSRTLYELERVSDLGDAMVQTTAVRLELARVIYQWQLNEAQLKALTGELIREDTEK